MTKPVDEFIRSNTHRAPEAQRVQGDEFWRGVDHYPASKEPVSKPDLSPAKKAAKREAENAKARVTQDGHFHCSSCGDKVVRPDSVSANDWAQRRRCAACVAANRQPPMGKRYCRKCGKLFKVLGCERFCRRDAPTR